MKILKTLFGVARAILTIVLVCLLAIILTQRISNNKMAIAGIRIFTVVTESMVPKYLVGDAILVRAMPIEELQVGDDITYLGAVDSFKDRIVTHRIIEKEKKEDGTYRIVTKGVANDKEDPEINETQVFGKVIYKIKSISYINGIIGNLYGMYFVIIVPMAFIFFFDFIGFRRDKEEELEEEERIRKKEKNEAEEDKEKDKEENEQEDEKIDEKKERRKRRRNKRRQRRKKNEE